MGYTDTDKLAINTIRVLAVRFTPHPSHAILPRVAMPYYPAIFLSKEKGVRQK